MEKRVKGKSLDSVINPEISRLVISSYRYYIFKGVNPVKLCIGFSCFGCMPKFCLQKFGQCDPVTERMIEIITADTNNPLTFTEGSKTFSSKTHPADEHASCPGRLSAEFTFKNVKIGSGCPVLVPLRFHQIKFIIQPKAAVDLFACVTERRTGGKFKGTEQVSQLSNRNPRVCGDRVFSSFISFTSEGQSIPCQIWTDLFPWLFLRPYFPVGNAINGKKIQVVLSDIHTNGER